MLMMKRLHMLKTDLKNLEPLQLVEAGDS